MPKNRVFTQEELKEMEPRTLNRVLEAIDSGDKEKAKELSNRMYQEFLGMHDFYMRWVTAFMSEIQERYGVEAFEEIEKATLKPNCEKLVKMFSKMDIQEKVMTFVTILRGHLQPVTVEEDDEKICLTMKPCGSGQRMLEEGVYQPPLNYSVIHEPGNITWGKPDFPIYCTHEPILEMLAIEAGLPFMVTFPAEKVATEPCRFCFYKDPAAIPEEFYSRVGKKKPEVIP